MPRFNPFENINPDDLRAVDWLALDRNMLANERTFLAYLRTGFSMIALAMVVLKWFDHPALLVLGVTSIGLGALLMVWGLVRFLVERRRYARLGSPARK